MWEGLLDGSRDVDGVQERSRTCLRQRKTWEARETA